MATCSRAELAQRLLLQTASRSPVLLSGCTVASVGGFGPALAGVQDMSFGSSPFARLARPGLIAGGLSFSAVFLNARASCGQTVGAARSRSACALAHGLHRCALTKGRPPTGKEHDAGPGQIARSGPCRPAGPGRGWRSDAPPFQPLQKVVNQPRARRHRGCLSAHPEAGHRARTKQQALAMTRPGPLAAGEAGDRAQHSRAPAYRTECKDLLQTVFQRPVRVERHRPGCLHLPDMRLGRGQGTRLTHPEQVCNCYRRHPAIAAGWRSGHHEVTLPESGMRVHPV